MAMDMFSTENSTTASPRISFSLNLDNSLIESYPYRSDSSSDFNFCITSDPIENETSSADELFCDGLIRPSYNEEKGLVVTNSSADELFCDGFIRPSYKEEKGLVVTNSSADELFCDGFIRPNYNEEERVVVANSSADELFDIRHNCLEEKRLLVTDSSGDELFCDGLLHQRLVVTASSSSPSTHATNDQERSKEMVSIQSKSFWRIKRSSSLHCESTKQRSSFWSSLPLLSRSNSTGSVMKDRHNKHNPSQKQGKNSSMAVYSQKPPLKRNHGRAHDYGAGIIPVLNVPPPFVSKGAANLLGLGSFFGHGNDHKNKK